MLHGTALNYNFKWHYYFCLKQSRWNSLYDLDTLTRTRETFLGKENLDMYIERSRIIANVISIPR